MDVANRMESRRRLLIKVAVLYKLYYDNFTSARRDTNLILVC